MADVLLTMLVVYVTFDAKQALACQTTLFCQLFYPFIFIKFMFVKGKMQGKTPCHVDGAKTPHFRHYIYRNLQGLCPPLCWATIAT